MNAGRKDEAENEPEAAFEDASGIKEKWYCILGGFLGQYWTSALTFLLFAAIYLIVFSLYDLETEAVLYAAGLCLLAALFIVGVRFYRYIREHRERLRVLQNIQIEFDRLPESKNPMEQDYQRMLRALGQICVTCVTDLETKRQETLDYYTAWVHQIKTPIAVMRMQLQGEDTPEHQALLAELVLVMVSTTGSMMVGIEDSIRERYPRDFGIYLYEADREQLEDLQREVRRFAEQEQLAIENDRSNYYLGLTTLQRGNVYYSDKAVLKAAGTIQTMEEMREVFIVALSDYNKQMGREEVLQADEVLVYYNRQKIDNKTLVFMDTEYKIARVLKEFPENGMSAMNIVSSHSIVVADGVYEQLRRKIETNSDNLYSYSQCYYGFDTMADKETQSSLRYMLADRLGELGMDCTIEIRAANRAGLWHYMEVFFSLASSSGHCLSWQWC